MARIACPFYLNTAPLIYGLDPHQYTFVFDVPSRLQKLLSENQVDIALLPIISYLHHKDFQIIPDLAICSHGPVRSVKLSCHHPKINLKNAKSIVLDQASKTSQKLTQVLASQAYGRRLKDIHWEKEDNADLELIIGDRALTEHSPHGSIDLGQEWKNLTNLPFVYACWMALKTPSPSLIQDLHFSLKKGLEHLDLISEKQKLIHKADALSYLKKNIQYQLGKKEILGLQTFFEFVNEMETCKHDTTLKFVA